ncbi:MAG: hypothetical protein J7639_04460 [Paenibacillaceae bacterium]|nr:hypothetical protein [Paenibacillaceae bacterium]
MGNGQSAVVAAQVKRPDAGKLANWLLTWVQPSGAIHGFHNHSVWGSNPYRWSDFTSGHSTWASPLLPSLALALRGMREGGAEAADERVRGLQERLLQMIRFQTSPEAFQEDGQYAHIGFQMGESLKAGLIHNAMPNAALGMTALFAGDWLPEASRESIRLAMERSFAACDKLYPYGIMYEGARAISNQEYARLWGKLLYRRVYGESEVRSDSELIRQIDKMIEQFHFRGLPDADCEASYRYSNTYDSTEPGEYYGLLIGPLVLAYELFGDSRYLDHAGALSRHLARSAWYDENGCARMHRVWYKSGTRWVKLDRPMLIAGMGISLYAIHDYLRHRDDAELTGFLRQCDATYAYYQNPRGYLTSASGWDNEADVAPASTWQSHDLLYMIARYGYDRAFGETLLAPGDGRISVLLGSRCIWMEQGERWTITDYHAIDVHQLLGRKDEAVFGRDMSWVGGPRTLPERFNFADRPGFMKTNEGIYLMPGAYGEADIDLSNASGMPYLGLWK